MSSEMVSQNETRERDRLAENLSQLDSWDAEDLVRTQALGDAFDFRPAVADLHRILSLFRELHGLDLDRVPHPTLKALADASQQAVDVLRQVEEFDPSAHQNPSQQRDSLITNLENSYGKWFGIVAPTIAFATRTGTDFAELQRQASAKLSEIEQIVESAESQMAASTEEAQSVLEAIKTTAAEAGVSEHARYFEEESQLHADSAKIWLRATIGLAILTGASAIAALYLWLDTAAELEVGTAIQVGLAKLLFFSVLYFALAWAGRNYQAHRHNQTVNRHRRNALGSFEAFVAATTDDATKNAVLLQATQSIFAPQSSGYLAKDGHDSQSPQILEIFRTASGSASDGS